MRPHILKPFTVSITNGVVTVSIATIMASDETTAIDRGVLMLRQASGFPSFKGWEEKATLNE